MKDMFPPKPHSMSPPARDTKVIIAGTSEHIFLELLQINFSWSISPSMLLKLHKLNLRWHGPIMHTHSMTCRQTLLSMQLVLYSKIYSLETSLPETPRHIGPSPWFCIFLTVTISVSSPSSSLHNHHQPMLFWNYLNLTWRYNNACTLNQFPTHPFHNPKYIFLKLLHLGFSKVQGQPHNSAFCTQPTFSLHPSSTLFDCRQQSKIFY